LAAEFLEADREFLSAGSKPANIALIYSSEAVSVDAQGPAGDVGEVELEAQALRDLGHTVEVYGISYANFRLVKKLEADFVFNLCEGTGLDGDPGVEVILALERRLLPFSGVGSAPYNLTNDKFAMKKALAAAGVPVPAGFVCRSAVDDLPQTLDYPLFVKPRYGFGSLCVDEHSVVGNEVACRQAVKSVIDATGIDALVEQYIAGREITVGVIGNDLRAVVMPPLEVCFGEVYRGKPLIRTYDTKRNAKSPLYWGFHTLCPAPLEEQVLKRVQETALKAYRAVGGDGFGRVDMRLTAGGLPVVLEVNANCSLEEAEDEHDAGMLSLMARALGWSYAGLLARIIGAGVLRPIRRYRLPKVALRKEGAYITSYAAVNLTKGALISPLYPVSLSAKAEAERYCLEPEIRFMPAVGEPNVVPQLSRNVYWLAAARNIKEGEKLVFDRAQLFAINLAGEPTQRTSLFCRGRRRVR